MLLLAHALLYVGRLTVVGTDGQNANTFLSAHFLMVNMNGGGPVGLSSLTLYCNKLSYHRLLLLLLCMCIYFCAADIFRPDIQRNNENNIGIIIIGSSITNGGPP